MTMLFKRALSGTPELFTPQSNGLIDEQDQPSDIPFGQPAHLAFPDHVHDFVALHRPPGCVEGPKPLAGFTRRLIARWSCSTRLFR
jgi:hypothetical protein